MTRFEPWVAAHGLPVVLDSQVAPVVLAELVFLAARPDSRMSLPTCLAAASAVPVAVAAGSVALVRSVAVT